MKKYYLLIILFFISLTANAQQSVAPLPYYMIYSQAGKEALNNQLRDLDYPEAMPVFEDAGLYKVQLNDEAYKNLSNISHNLDLQIYSNDPVELRTLPSDPGVANMWTIGSMNLEKAWGFDQDGLTANGHQIVVTVLDTGIEVTHDDLAENIWVNEGEIPGNGIDDDNNGYIDDYNSYDFKHNVAYLEPKDHATHIAGIVGAVANNGTGAAGVSWHTKMMNLGPANFPVDIGAALDYVYKRRKLFNESHGAQGDFIAAINCSWGWPNRLPTDYPGICNAFNLLSQVGVISVVATTNSIQDVNQDGDMPAACLSDAMIAVTAIDRDEKLGGGYGNKYIDIAAPGIQVWSSVTENKYRNNSGTSMAAPHIVGAVAFLYDIACEEFYEGIFDNPANQAIRIKDAILNNVRYLPSLEGKVKTEGTIDLYTAAIEITNCGNANIGKIAFTNNNIYPNPVSNNGFLNVEITHPDFKTYKFDIFNALGELVDEVVFDANPNSSMYQIDVSGYQAGIYYIRFYRCPGNYNRTVDCYLRTEQHMSRYLKNTDIAIAKFIVQ